MVQDRIIDCVVIFAWVVVFGLKFTFTLWPETTELESFFKYDDQLMTRPAYVDYFSDCITYVILSILMFKLLPKQRGYLFYISLIWVGYFAEFWFMYNQPIAKPCGLPLGFSFIAAIALFYMLLYSLIKLYKTYAQFK